MRANTSAAESRSDRRKRETRARLLGAALRVFVERGFDGATTGEMAEAADVGAGTFYLHFKDKRDVYQTIVRHAARDMIERWRAALRPGMPLGDVVALGLEITAAFWEEDRGRARLMLEGGPAFGAEAHMRLVHVLAEIIRSELRSPRAAYPDFPAAETIATVILGLGIELGRVIVGGDAAAAERLVAGTIALARRGLGPARSLRVSPPRR